MLRFDKEIPIIEAIVNVIVSVAEPDKIVLFGSYAKGENHEKSDIDILVIKRNLDNEVKLTKLLYNMLYTKGINVPIDIISVEYERFYDKCEELSNIMKTINNEGRILYEAI